ncbi:MAG: sulfatase, partial [Phycisphaerae bacterium]
MNTTRGFGWLGACLAVFALWSASAAGAAEPATADRPNIVLLFSDDNGYADVGYQGCKDIPTPHIDSLAKGGVRFSNGYVSCPVCSPTRAGLMTGRYQQRFGHEFNPGGQGPPNFGLPVDQITLADRLKAAGYVTGMVGKWHLGFKEEHNPTRRGFEEFFGFLGGAHPYLQHGGTILRGFEVVPEQEYLTDAFGREAVAFIDRHAKERFFLYLSFNAVHSPLQATDKYLKRFPDIADEKRRTHAAMLSAMDDAIGAVLAKLRKEGLEEKTLIFFLSDNGGPTAQTTSSNLPLRGVKGQVLEGGIRVPFLVQWKGKLPEGRVFDHPVIALDVFPTALAAAGGEVPKDRPIDGVNLLPYLTGRETGPPHEALFWRFGPQMAVRMGDWKLIRFKPAANQPPAAARRAEALGGTTQLYNLARDIGEEKNLAESEPDKVAQLERALEAWNAQLVAPLW